MALVYSVHWHTTRWKSVLNDTVQSLEEEDMGTLKAIQEKWMKENQGNSPFFNFSLHGKVKWSVGGYTFLCRAEKVNVLGPWRIHPDPDDAFIRELFWASFKAGEFDFTLSFRAQWTIAPFLISRSNNDLLRQSFSIRTAGSPGGR